MIDTTGCTPEMKEIIDSFNKHLANLDAIEEVLNTPNITREEANRRIKELDLCYDDDDYDELDDYDDDDDIDGDYDD